MWSVLLDKFADEGSKSFSAIEDPYNQQHVEGHRLRPFAQPTATTAGFGGSNHTVCNLMFEKMF